MPGDSRREGHSTQNIPPPPSSSPSTPPSSNDAVRTNRVERRRMRPNWVITGFLCFKIRQHRAVFNFHVAIFFMRLMGYL